jgi:hypothetical protein
MASVYGQEKPRSGQKTYRSGEKPDADCQLDIFAGSTLLPVLINEYGTG